MSDINAAPSSTETTAEANVETKLYADGSSATGIAIPDVSPLDNQAPVVTTQEAGTATAGETTGIQAIPSGSGSSASAAASNITSTTASPDGASAAIGTTSTDAGNASAADTGSSADAGAAIDTGDAPAVAASGEGSGSAVPATSASNVADSADAGGAAADEGNAAASPAAGQSASDTASSAQVVWQGGDTAAAALRAELDAANSRIAALQQQVMDEQERVIKWQGLYNSATEAKPHAESILQKLEAGEAIVLGDLQSRLRAFVDAM